MTIFEFDSYKSFLEDWIQGQPRKGRGQVSQIAKLLGIHTTMVTHVIRGKANLSVSQAVDLSRYIGLSEFEMEYFLLLVQKEREAGKVGRDYFDQRLKKMRQESLSISKQIKVSKSLSEADQARFYSYWHYSAIRLIVSLEGCKDTHSIAKALRLPHSKVQAAVSFLLSVGLCVEKNGQLDFGPAETFVGRESPHYLRHITNWRLKAIEHFDSLSNEDLALTYPVMVSEKDFLRVREILVKALSEIRELAGPSKSEVFACLNVDWTRIIGSFTS